MMASVSVASPAPTPSFNDLLAIERTSTRRADRPASLRLGDIQTAPNVFQLRKDKLNNPLLNNEHIRTLTSALQNGERYLEDLLVTPIGDKFYLVDGHHRLAAYTALDWDKAIPVQISEACVADVELEAGYGNHKDKLPVSKESKLEFAWTLVRRVDRSIAQIQRASGVGARTISNMRVKHKEMKGRDEDPWDYTWKGALAGNRTSSTFDMDSWVDRKAGEMAGRICQDTNLKVLKSPEVLAEAILKISDTLPVILQELWGIGPHDDDDDELDI